MAQLAEETSHLLPAVGITVTVDRTNPSTYPSPPSLIRKSKTLSLSHLKQLTCLPCSICIKSKAVILILVWSVVIGAVYLALLSGFGTLGFVLQHQEHNFHVTVYTIVSAYAFLALILLLYPISGYIADIHCGRYKAVTFSFLLIWISMLLQSAAGVGGLITNFPTKPGPSIAIPIGIFVVLSLLLVIVSLACYQSNIIQLGMDQLLEASSDKLALFLHWLMWSYNLGSFLALLSVVFIPCYVEVEPIRIKFMRALASGPFICLVFVTLLIAFTCYNHSWFYSEPGQNNPYKTVYKLLNFDRRTNTLTVFAVVHSPSVTISNHQELILPKRGICMEDRLPPHK